MLQKFDIPIANLTFGVDLHYCALTAQFLCSAFLSYIQAHVGSIEPLFGISLCGRWFSQEVGVCMETPPFKLICLVEIEGGTPRCDVLTSAENFLDTYGLGYVVCDEERYNNIFAIAVGGGFVSLQ